MLKKINGSFDCSFNNFKSLEGSPKVKGNFDCVYSNLKTLKGSKK